MDISASLSHDRSKQNVESIVRYILDHPQTLDKLMSLILSEDNALSFRASWVLGYLDPLGGNLFVPYMDRLLDMLEEKGHHPSVTRNITRLLQNIEIPETFHGRLTDIAFNILTAEDQLNAPRTNCMTILDKLVKNYPDLKQEFIFVLEELLRYKNDPSLQSRGRKILKRLKL